METLQRTANRGSISTGPYQIDNSLKLEADNSEYLHYTPSSQTDYERMAFSVWIKRTELGTTQTLAEFGNGTADTTQLRIGFDTDDRLFCYGNSTIWRQTNRLFRDTAAWYHLFFLFDTTTPGGVSNNRVRIWVNGEMIAHTDFGVINNPSSGSAMGFNKTNQQSLGTQDEDGPKNYFCGYIAQAYGSGGTPPVVGDFGETDSDTGIWTPKDISGITPPDANGFNLDFSDSSDLGNDISSRNNDFTLNNIAAIDQATDTPTNNFCTINPLVDNNFSIWSLTEGGTRGPNTGETNCSVGTFAVSSGKWYWEGVTTAFSGTNYWKWGVIRADVQQGNSADPATDAGSSWYTGDNAYYTQTSTSASSVAYNTGFTGYTAGDIWSISLNCDVSPYVMTFRINNSVPGTSANNTDRSVGTFASSGPVVPFFMLYNSSSDDTWHNFGNPFLAALSGGNSDANGYGDFKYEPPSGYYALCSKNLSEFGG